MVWSAMPLSWLLAQPRPCWAMSAPSGSAPYLGGVARAVALAEGVAARDQGDGLLVVHAHPGEGLADVAAGPHRVGLALRPFRIDVDQAHLHRREGVLEHLLLAVAVAAEPFVLGAPVDVLLGLPDVGAAAAEAEHRPAHGFDGDVAGHDHQVGPGQLGAVLLLDRPQQAARLVQVAVVRPAVERGEALPARRAAAAAVGGAVGADAVPGHADEEAAVVAVVGRPPGLAVGHQGVEVALDRLIVERLERLGVVEPVAHRVPVTAMLVEDSQRQLVGPPVAVVASEQRPQRSRFLARVMKRSGVVHGAFLGCSRMCPTSPRPALRCIDKMKNFIGRIEKIYGAASP